VRAQFLPLLLALLFGAAQGAWAQHKCVSPEGKVTYSEQPCAGAARPQAITRGASSSASPVGGGAGAPSAPAATKVNYYDVHGADIAGVVAALNARGTYHGRADWKLSYKYSWRAAGGGCAVEALNTELELVMMLPRWTPPAGVSADLVSRWERYMAALRVHEEGHLDHGRAAERELKASASRMQAADCAALDAAVRQRFEGILADYRARDKDYDARTEHGKSQGAWLQP
jgi:predicted secreted Zn-dependent protease